jgi:hypothetical protein
MPIKDNLVYATYYAPRGRKRLYTLASVLSMRYLYPTDLLIGVIGGEGSGKSTLIQGLFPGLELTNDDEGVNVNPTPIFEFSEDDFFSAHTFHLDIRYESAFRQTYEIVDAIKRAIDDNRRVVVEHFDLIYRPLGMNAQVIFGIGEDVRVYRPSIFGPLPEQIKKVTDESLRFRLMTHSAEDLVQYVLGRDYGVVPAVLHSDVRHGFIIGFSEKPKPDLQDLEDKVKALIAANVPIRPDKGDYIRVGEDRVYCTGKRIHVKSSSEIENFRLIKQYVYDPHSRQYLLVGIVGREEIDGFDEAAFAQKET